uniref:Uncharacterized protein n=1 Tax=Strigamia maritima TaxID=126957 RepID=T1IX19_STRMM
MNHLRLLYLATTTTGLLGYLYTTLTQKHLHKVNAQPSHSPDKDDDCVALPSAKRHKSMTREEFFTKYYDRDLADNPVIKKVRDTPYHEEMQEFLENRRRKISAIKARQFAAETAADAAAGIRRSTPIDHTLKTRKYVQALRRQKKTTKKLEPGTWRPTEIKSNIAPQRKATFGTDPCLLGHGQGKRDIGRQRVPHRESVMQVDRVRRDLSWIRYLDGGVIFPYPMTGRRTLFEYDDFVVCYDNSMRAPCWSLEEITPKSGELSVDSAPAPEEIRVETWVPLEFRTEIADYNLMCGSVKLQFLAEFDLHTEDIDNPCVLTNVVPQVITGDESTVRNLWDEFRAYIVYLASTYERIFILTGCLYLPCERRNKRIVKYKLLGKKSIAIPTHFYKVIVYQNPDETFHFECYKFKNKAFKSHDLRKFLVQRDQLEKEAGFQIFNKIENANVKDWSTDKTFCTFTSTTPPPSMRYWATSAIGVCSCLYVSFAYKWRRNFMKVKAGPPLFTSDDEEIEEYPCDLNATQRRIYDFPDLELPASSDPPVDPKKAGRRRTPAVKRQQPDYPDCPAPNPPPATRVQPMAINWICNYRNPPTQNPEQLLAMQKRSEQERLEIIERKRIEEIEKEAQAEFDKPIPFEPEFLCSSPTKGSGASGHRATINWAPYAVGGKIFPHPKLQKRWLLEYEDFIMCYDNAKRVPCWVLEEVRYPMESAYDELWYNDPNRDEPRVPKDFRTTSTDYTDRQIENSITTHYLAEFHLRCFHRTEHCVCTNLAVQIVDNDERGQVDTVWDAIRLYIAHLARVVNSVHVLTGPLYLPQQRFDGKWTVKYNLVPGTEIAIPTHFFKAILAEDERRDEFLLECYIFENKHHYNLDTTQFNVTREELERKLGFRVFPEVPDTMRFWATFIGLGTCLYSTLANKWRQNFMKVNAQPDPDLQLEEIYCNTNTTQRIIPKRPRSCEPPTERPQHARKPAIKRLIPDYPEPPANLSYAEKQQNTRPSAIKRQKSNHPDFCALDWTPYTSGGKIFPHPKIQKRFLLEYNDFIVCYDNAKRAPCWTLEQVTQEKETAYNKDGRYKEEIRVPEEFRTGHEDYTCRRFADYFNVQFATEFYLHDYNRSDHSMCTNLLAQKMDHSYLYDPVWTVLRAYIKYLAFYFDNIYVLTGTLFLPQRNRDGKWRVKYDAIAGSEIAIPTHFFKVILCEHSNGTFRIECYRFENKIHESLDLRQFVVRKSELERQTGFRIFKGVDNRIITGRGPDKNFIKEISSSSSVIEEISSDSDIEEIYCSLNDEIPERPASRGPPAKPTCKKCPQPARKPATKRQIPVSPDRPAFPRLADYPTPYRSPPAKRQRRLSPQGFVPRSLLGSPPSENADNQWDFVPRSPLCSPPPENADNQWDFVPRSPLGSPPPENTDNQWDFVPRSPPGSPPPDRRRTDRKPSLRKRFLIEYNDFIVCYDNAKRAPCWTLEQVYSDMKNVYMDEQLDLCYDDEERVAEEFRTCHEDYTNRRFKNNFQGQLLTEFSHPNDNCLDHCVCTNLVAQKVNKDCPSEDSVWNIFRIYIRHLSEQFMYIYVLTGPLYLPRENYENGKWIVKYDIMAGSDIAIPTHFFKVLLCEHENGTFRLECYRFENKVHRNVNISQFNVRKRDLERQTGFRIFKDVENTLITGRETDKNFTESIHINSVLTSYNNPSMRYWATSAIGLGTCLYATFTNKWKRKFMTVTAQPSSSTSSDEEIHCDLNATQPISPERPTHGECRTPAIKRPESSQHRKQHLIKKRLKFDQPCDYATPYSSFPSTSTNWNLLPAFQCDLTSSDEEEETETETEYDYNEEYETGTPCKFCASSPTKESGAVGVHASLSWDSYASGGKIFPHPKIQKRFLIEYVDFVVCYDNLNRAPCWTLEQVTQVYKNVRDDVDCCNDNVEEDSIPEEFRTGQDDYEVNNFQHLAEYYLRWRQKSHLLVCSNLVVKRVDNDDPFAETVFDELRSYIAFLTQRNKNIYILSGPLYLPGKGEDDKWSVKYEVLDGSEIAIPTHFFKVLLCEDLNGRFSLECFRFENKVYDGVLDLRQFIVKKEDLERQVGFLIFKEVDERLITRCGPDEDYTTFYHITVCLTGDNC